MSAETAPKYELVRALEKLGVDAWVQNSGKAKGGKIRLGKPGMGDVLGYYPSGTLIPWDNLNGCRLVPGGAIFSVEFKVEGARTAPARREAQAAWAARIRKAGGVAIQAYTAVEALRALGFLG